MGCIKNADGSFSKSFTITVLVIGVSLMANLMYQPLPHSFPQPFKYMAICFGSDFLSNIGYILETYDITHRINVTRAAYYVTVGLINIRDDEHQIEVRDEPLEHISLRIFKPKNSIYHKSNLPTPTIIFYHGGGYFVGNADVIEPITYELAKRTDYLVIYVEYRLIPEHKFPAAINDSFMATQFILKNYQKYNIDLDNLILMGDSAGGNLATVISQKLSEKKLAKPKLQVLVYPILQMFDFSLPSYRINLPKRILGNIDHANFKNFMHYYTGYEVDDSIFLNGHTTSEQKEALSKYVNIDYLPDEFRTLDNVTGVNDTTGKYKQLRDILLHPDVSPLLVDDDYLLQHTPKHTLLFTTEMDILRDDGYIYAARLKKLGINYVHKHFKDYFHGILGLLYGPLKFDRSHHFMDEVVKLIKKTMTNDS